MKKKTVQSVKNSLKFKAQPKSGIISVRVGVKKYVVPVEARMLSNGEHIFLSFPACSELFKLEGKSLQAMDPKADATDAYAALNPTKKRARKRAANVDMPDQLASALKNIPSGYKLGYGADGSPKLIRTRKRTKKAKAAPKSTASAAKPAAKAPARKPAARKTAARKTTARKTTARKPAARKTTRRVTRAKKK